MENRNIKKSVILFSIVAVSSGWIGILVEKLLAGHLKEGDTPGMGLWLLFPVMTAILIRVFMKNGWKSLGIRPKFKGNVKWYIISAIIFPIIFIIVLVLGYITNWTDMSKLDIGRIMFVFLGVFVGSFIKNIFEECAWRGFLTERLIKLKISDGFMYFITAIIWFMWHIPYYLVLLSSNGTSENRIKLLIIAFITLGCWSMMFTELYRLTRSIWPCVVLHATVNSLVVINDYISISSGKGLFLSYDTGIISLAICICVGICLRRYRKRQIIAIC